MMCKVLLNMFRFVDGNVDDDVERFGCEIEMPPFFFKGMYIAVNDGCAICTVKDVMYDVDKKRFEVEVECDSSDLDELISWGWKPIG